jgi:hypothetical protein
MRLCFILCRVSFFGKKSSKRHLSPPKPFENQNKYSPVISCLSGNYAVTPSKHDPSEMHPLSINPEETV